jgi:hypothetical protein
MAIDLIFDLIFDRYKASLGRQPRRRLDLPLHAPTFETPAGLPDLGRRDGLASQDLGLECPPDGLCHLGRR